MIRILFFIAIAGLVYLLLRSYRNSATRPPEDTPRTTENMVVCAQCGVHVPSSESVQGHGRNFCCAAHRDAYRD